MTFFSYPKIIQPYLLNTLINCHARSHNLCGSHRARFLWASHINHHSNEQLNFATALRQSWIRKQLD